MSDKVHEPIVVGEHTELPFSRGILARSLVKCGLDPVEAYNIAVQIQSSLDRPRYTKKELARLVLKALRKGKHTRIAKRYRESGSEPPGIKIRDKRDALFSKGLLARSLRVTAIDSSAALSIARRIERQMRKSHLEEITVEQLRNKVIRELKKEGGKRAVQRYKLWRNMVASDNPLIILIGGPTGAGKSTLSLELASRLEITQVVSTDVIRSILRTMFSEMLLPAIHKSSYLVGEKIKMPPGSGSSKVLVGFHQQSLLVNVGVESTIRRSIHENVDLIINGVHLLPGLIDKNKFPNARIVQFVVTVSDPQMHMQRFLQRQHAARNRVATTYQRNFKSICKIRDYIIECAREEKIPIIENVHIEESMEEALSYVFEDVTSSGLLTPRKSGKKRRSGKKHGG